MVKKCRFQEKWANVLMLWGAASRRAPAHFLKIELARSAVANPGIRRAHVRTRALYST